MMAYGQVESTWPVVGGVLVAGDTAYAIAGRTSEADGGLYVIALDPLTGAAVWPKATRFYQNDPGDIRILLGDKKAGWNNFGATLAPRLHIKTEYVGTVDLLGSDGTTLQIGCRGYGNIDCKTGSATPKDCKTSVFGRLVNLPFASGASGAPYNPAAFVLGKTKFQRVGSFAPKTKSYQYSIQKQGGWKLETGSSIGQAVCLAGDKLFVGLTDNAPGNPKGELCVLSTTDGQKLSTVPLPAPPAYDGIAVANGNVYVTLTDATVMCLGKK
jgi:hypothetical protein